MWSWIPLGLGVKNPLLYTFPLFRLFFPLDIFGWHWKSIFGHNYTIYRGLFGYLKFSKIHDGIINIMKN